MHQINDGGAAGELLEGKDRWIKEGQTATMSRLAAEWQDECADGLKCETHL